MKQLSKQDRNGVRTPTDIERRYKLNKLEDIADYDKEIADIKENKVDKVAGKDLSSNDFTNGYKQQVEDNTESRHTHSNKEILDTYTQTNEELSGAVSNTHTHNNKELLDSYTQTETDIADAVSKKHEHSNKSLLDSYTNSDTDITEAINNTHTHSNKTALDSIVSGTTQFNLSSYASSNFSILRSTCVSKNKRVCVSLVGSIAISARTTATILNLPNSLIPSTQKDFVVFGTTSSSSICGWGNISTSGTVSVWFPEAITTYIRTNFVYDIDY